MSEMRPPEPGRTHFSVRLPSVSRKQGGDGLLCSLEATPMMTLLDAHTEQERHHTNTCADHQGEREDVRREQSDEHTHEDAIDHCDHTRGNQEDLPARWGDAHALGNAGAVIARRED